VKHFLKHTFGNPYDEHYYAGDWMLGPNLFCWMPICSVQYDVNALAFHVKPATYEDVEYVIKTILKHKDVIDQYRYVRVALTDMHGLMCVISTARNKSNIIYKFLVRYAG